MKNQDPHHSEWLSPQGDRLHRAETKAGRPPRRGCLLAAAILSFLIFAATVALFIYLN